MAIKQALEILTYFNCLTGGKKSSRKKKKQSDSSHSSTSSQLSTRDISLIVEDLKQQQHRNSTKKNYYAVWHLLNQFFIRLDAKPNAWEDRLTLCVGYLVQNNC